MVMAVEARARIMAPTPKAAVPPSVRQACLRFTTKPQMAREILKRMVRVALQTLRTLPMVEMKYRCGLSGANWVNAATTASGPRRTKMSWASRREGYMRVRKCMCVALNAYISHCGKTWQDG